MRTLLGTAALLGTVSFASMVNARAYNPNYGLAGTPGSAIISITTSGTANPDGSFTVLTAAGNVDGNAVTGLIAYPNQPAPATSVDGLFIYDNNFYRAGTALNSNGPRFSVGATEYNLFSTGPTSYTLYLARGGAYGANSTGTLSVAAVPEPDTWAMMILGFGMVGFGLRGRRRQQLRITYA